MCWDKFNLSEVPEVGKNLALLWNPQILAFKRHGRVWQAQHENVVCAHQSFMKIFKKKTYLLLHRAIIERLASDVDTMLYPLFIVSSCHRTRRRHVDRFDNVVHCHIIQCSSCNGQVVQHVGDFRRADPPIFCAVVDHQVMLLPSL